MNNEYVHGYEQRERVRLRDQAATLLELLLSDTTYPAGSSILEAGCGVGAQTITLARENPAASITSVDISAASVMEAKGKLAGADNVTFMQADIFQLPFGVDTFDHLFVCFVLEHLKRPVDALCELKKLLKPGGTITVIEGDHGSAYFHPDRDYARRVIECQVTLQKQGGGNALIGRELYPLLNQAGFADIHVSPRMVYVDATRPQLVEGFTRKTFTAMIEGTRKAAINAGIISPDNFDRGIAALYRTTEPDGVFCYTFFKAVAVK
jgi:SAM-dependent methyltransferase